MNLQLVTIAGIVGGGFATMVTLWLVGIALARSERQPRRPLWVFTTVVTTMVAAGLAIATIYALHIGVSVHGWFAQKVIQGEGWAGELGALMLLVWALAFVVGHGPFFILGRSQPQQSRQSPVPGAQA